MATAPTSSSRRSRGWGTSSRASAAEPRGPDRPDRGSPFWLPSAILALGLLSAALWIGSDVLRSRVAAQEIARMRAAGEIQVAVTTSHLWLEEYVSGDVGQNLQEVWANLDRARDLAEALLNGGRPAGLAVALEPLEKPDLRRQAQALIDRIRDFRARALERQQGRARGEDTGIGSASDADFDRIFRELSREARALEGTVEKQMARDETR